jgi:hypothetical protein
MRNVRRSGSWTPFNCAASFAFTSGSREITCQFVPQRHVCRLDEVENFSRQNALHDEFHFFFESEFSRGAAFHEPRKHFLQQGCARPELFIEAILDETGNRIIKTVGKEQRGAAVAVRAAVALAHAFEKCFRGFRRRSFRKNRRGELPAVIVRPADKNLLPRLRVCRRQVMAIGERLDFFRRQLFEQCLRQIA